MTALRPLPFLSTHTAMLSVLGRKEAWHSMQLFNCFSPTSLSLSPSPVNEHSVASIVVGWMTDY